MTHDSDNFHSGVIGLYSPWPRRQTTHRVKLATLAGVAAVAVFAHCLAPLI